MTECQNSERVVRAIEAVANTLSAEAEKKSRRNTMWSRLKFGMVLLVLIFVGSCWTKVIG